MANSKRIKVPINITLVDRNRSFKKTLKLDGVAGEPLYDTLVREIERKGGHVREMDSKLGKWISEIEIDGYKFENIQIRNKEGELPVIMKDDGNALWAGLNNILVSKEYTYWMITDDSNSNINIDLPNLSPTNNDYTNLSMGLFDKVGSGGACPSTPVDLDEVDVKSSVIAFFKPTDDTSFDVPQELIDPYSSIPLSDESTFFYDRYEPQEEQSYDSTYSVPVHLSANESNGAHMTDFVASGIYDRFWYEYKFGRRHINIHDELKCTSDDESYNLVKPHGYDISSEDLPCYQADAFAYHEVYNENGSENRSASNNERFVPKTSVGLAIREIRHTRNSVHGLIRNVVKARARNSHISKPCKKDHALANGTVKLEHAKPRRRCTQYKSKIPAQQLYLLGVGSSRVNSGRKKSKPTTHSRNARKCAGRQAKREPKQDKSHKHKIVSRLMPKRTNKTASLGRLELLYYRLLNLKVIRVLHQRLNLKHQPTQSKGTQVSMISRQKRKILQVTSRLKSDVFHILTRLSSLLRPRHPKSKRRKSHNQLAKEKPQQKVFQERTLSFQKRAPSHPDALMYLRYFLKSEKKGNALSIFANLLIVLRQLRFRTLILRMYAYRGKSAVQQTRTRR